ncbi:RHS repeat protein [Streptomyces iconiensis]|uniref:RHS repeat protein n=1 Tax=Streptomyces iconiensis TaxID=1384038 RepID=A0ABT7A6R9_9ACTN|nr:RHS repeat domain-containing protein [Streptomyces iconiensis]MDJ1136782.1 RHS repeat protein [Streptomyces iconiensis]
MDGNVESYEDPGGKTAYAYDAANRLTELTAPGSKKTTNDSVGRFSFAKETKGAAMNSGWQYRNSMTRAIRRQQSHSKPHEPPSQRAFAQACSVMRLSPLPHFESFRGVGGMCLRLRREDRRPSRPLLLPEVRLV